MPWFGNRGTNVTKNRPSSLKFWQSSATTPRCLGDKKSYGCLFITPTTSPSKKAQGTFRRSKLTPLSHLFGNLRVAPPFRLISVNVEDQREERVLPRENIAPSRMIATYTPSSFSVYSLRSPMRWGTETRPVLARNFSVFPSPVLGLSTRNAYTSFMFC